ncbi:MAG: metallopeptidase family protein [Anaerolineales bacterium]|nr:metallopeptidase family protein [Anaerolineales bacterium]MCB9128508.1 metallopeptidase family protein [Ardenticatenales bacterium]
MESHLFDDLVREALDELPQEFATLLDNVQVVVQAWPSPAQLASVQLRHPTQLLGLYEGIPRTERGSYYGQVVPDKISIFQYPIERICATDDAVRQQVRDTVMHELGHHFGLDEARLRTLEEERARRRRESSSA